MQSIKGSYYFFKIINYPLWNFKRNSLFRSFKRILLEAIGSCIIGVSYIIRSFFFKIGFIPLVWAWNDYPNLHSRYYLFFPKDAFLTKTTSYEHYYQYKMFHYKMYHFRLYCIIRQYPCQKILRNFKISIKQLAHLMNICIKNEHSLLTFINQGI